jgi:prepilin-type N-terminal cleavage/methylation domain-containing protein
MSHTLKSTKGFTLIELLVVIAIIGILSSVVLASLSTARAKSRDARRISDIGQVQLALELYYDTASAYPAGATYGAASTSLTALSPSYLPKFPVDPQNTTAYNYRYAATGTGPSTYVLTALLERGDNAALLTDADVASGAFGGTAFTGASTDCVGTTGTAQTNGQQTERCYDITN